MRDEQLGDDDQEFQTPSQPHPRDLNNPDLQTLIRHSNDIGIVIKDTPNPDGVSVRRFFHDIYHLVLE